MEPEGSLLYSQEPATGTYPEPDEFNPYFMFNSFVVKETGFLSALW
jgi:hypothetical protein